MAAREVQIVWFKRDLRAADHAPLTAAAASGPVLPLYVIEPELWSRSTMAGRQWAFVAESLAELARDLARAGAPLVVRRGDAVDVLDALRRRLGSVALWSHEETGDTWTYARDRRVAAWARAQGVAWTEMPGAGVVRRLHSRDGWAGRWNRTMARAVLPVPALRSAPSAVSDPLAAPLGPDPCPERQPGGRDAGLALLESFLSQRGRTYRRAMSSPVTAYDACSRLSPHLA